MKIDLIAAADFYADPIFIDWAAFEFRGPTLGPVGKKCTVLPHLSALSYSSSFLLPNLVEGLYCKRPIQRLASYRILTPHLLTARWVCTRLWCGGGHTRWVERGLGVNIWKTPDTALYSTYLSTLCLIPLFLLCRIHPSSPPPQSPWTSVPSWRSRPSWSLASWGRQLVRACRTRAAAGRYCTTKANFSAYF